MGLEWFKNICHEMYDAMSRDDGTLQGNKQEVNQRVKRAIRNLMGTPYCAKKAGLDASGQGDRRVENLHVPLSTGETEPNAPWISERIAENWDHTGTLWLHG